jgi:hypothetical protein
MNRTTVAVVALALALVAAAGVLWLSANVELVPETKKTPPVPSVAVDPWTGFVRGLEAEGLVQRYSSLDEVDRDEASLVVVRWADLKDQEPQPWLDWVDGGGRLWVVVDEGDWEGPWTTVDPFSGVGEGEGSLSDAEGSVTATAPNGGVVTVSPFWWWKVPRADVRYQFGEKTAVAVWNRGDGWLMLSGPAVAVENEGLADDGNRRFAAAVTRGLEPAVVWVPSVTHVGPPESRGPPWPLIVGLGAFFGLLFWSLGPRFGPVLVTSEPERLGLAERLRAEARFLWDHGPRPRNRKRFMEDVTGHVSADLTADVKKGEPR